MALPATPNYVISLNPSKPNFSSGIFFERFSKEFLTFPPVFPLKQTGCGKFALRALSQSLAREFQPLGVHVAHVIIDGVVGPPRFLPFLIYFSSRCLRDEY